MKVLVVLARILVALVVLLVVAILGLWYAGRAKVTNKIDRRVPAFAAATDSAAIERGRHIASLTCAACHGVAEDLPLAANDTAFIESPVFATIHPPNLTPGGVLAKYSDGELARAIREGVNRDNRPMLMMPSSAFRGMSDQDLAALIGYMRAQPSITKATKPIAVGPMGGILLALGALPSSLQPAVEGPVPHHPEAPTAEYGAYIAPMYGCTECHGANLHGLQPGGPGPPPGPDIVAVAKQHPLEKFELALRHGVGTSGKQLSTDMPWAVYARMNDNEVQALYEYLKAQP